MTPQQIAAEVDVMAGLGHISMLTDEAQARRRAALTIHELLEANALLIRAVAELHGFLTSELDPDPLSEWSSYIADREVADFLDLLQAGQPVDAVVVAHG